MLFPTTKPIPPPTIVPIGPKILPTFAPSPAEANFPVLSIAIFLKAVDPSISPFDK